MAGISLCFYIKRPSEFKSSALCKYKTSGLLLVEVLSGVILCGYNSVEITEVVMPVLSEEIHYKKK